MVFSESKGPVMTDDERVLERVERWEALWNQGRSVSPDEVCADYPELLAEVREAARKLEQFGSFFSPDEAPESAPPRKQVDPKGQETADYAARPSRDTTPEATDASVAFIGKYRVVECLGGGGQAEVYRAIHPNLPGRDVVIKWARNHLPERRQQELLAEGRVLAGLEEAGVARVYDVDVAEGRPFVVMEFVRGRTLQQQLNDRRPSFREAAALVARLAGSLERVHRHGVVHRDLKPANILIDADGRPRLVDFGLALSEQPWDPAGRLPDDVAGTFAYMAPEQANGRGERVGPRADVFGLGAVLYALLTGRAPFPHPEPMGAWQQARLGTVVPPRELNPRVPRALERICLKALARDPQARYESAGRFGAALERHLRRRWAAAVLGATALVCVAGLVWWLGFRPSGPLGPQTGGSGAPPATAAALTGELIVQVWTPDGKGKAGLRVDEPNSGALPVRNGEWVHLKAALNQPAYVYLLWVEPDGKVETYYPWSRYDTVETPPPPQTPRQEVDSPKERTKGWQIHGNGGLETILLVARREPLGAEVKLGQVIGKLPPARFAHPQQVLVRGFDRGRPVDTVDLALSRGGSKEAEEIDHPLLLLMERLRGHFELVRAVRFAHQGD